MDQSFESPLLTNSFGDLDRNTLLNGPYVKVPFPETNFWDDPGALLPSLPTFEIDHDCAQYDSPSRSPSLDDWVFLSSDENASIDPSLAQDYAPNIFDGAYPELGECAPDQTLDLYQQGYHFQDLQNPLWGSDSGAFSDRSPYLASSAQWSTGSTVSNNDEQAISLEPSIDATIRLPSNTAANAARVKNRKRVRSQPTRYRTLNAANQQQVEEPKEESEDESADGPPNKRLACPFYKFDRVKHLHCAHFHLKRVKDVKQHLLRKHRFHCQGCHEGFKDKEKCVGHVQAKQCHSGADHLQPGGIDEGISQSQFVELLQRMNPREDDHSWYSIWEILFPGKPAPASPFLRSGVEEVISTVCDLWQKNGAKVMSSLSDAPFPPDMAANAELSFPRLCPGAEKSPNDHLLRLLSRLAKVSVLREDIDEKSALIAQPILPMSVSNTTPPGFADQKTCRSADTLASSVKVENLSYMRSKLKRRNERSRRNSRMNGDI